MQKRFFLLLAVCSAVISMPQTIAAQYTPPYSTSSVQGSTIITNYYDPNAALNTGPGLGTSPLQSRFTEPLNQFGTSLGTYAIPSPSYSTPSSLPLVQYQGQVPLSTTYQPPVYQQSAFQQPPVNYLPPQQYPLNRPQPVLLNPVGSYNGPQLPSTYADPTYPYPGLLSMMYGKWFGSEYLYDLPQNIGVVIEVIKPGNNPIDVDTQNLRLEVSKLFYQANIHPESLAIGEDPPLPFFHILILVYPDEEKTIAAISGRLMEKVVLARLNFNTPGTSQAITWEKMDLIITSHVQFHDQLQEAVVTIAKTFLDKVHYFSEEKYKLETGFRVKGCPQRRVPIKKYIPERECAPPPCPCEFGY